MVPGTNPSRLQTSEGQVSLILHIGLLLTKPQSAEIVRHIYEEMKLHIDYCAEYGLSKEDIMNHEEKQGMPTCLRI
jgi:hypothetical protein